MVFESRTKSQVLAQQVSNVLHDAGNAHDLGRNTNVGLDLPSLHPLDARVHFTKITA
ncbi:MAG TPA: hypothetical protein VGH87_15010 [Polyangiaceae bacterium]